MDRRKRFLQGRALLFGLVVAANLMAEEALPSMEMLMFLADFTDEQGNWNGEELEETPEQQPAARDESDE